MAVDARNTGKRGGSAATDRRRELVEHAARLFDRAGYHETSVDDVAAAAGIKKPTVYHYFSGKDEILFWIHDEFIDLLMAREQTRQKVKLTASQHLLEIIGDILDLMATHRGHVRAFFEHYRELTDEHKATIKAKRDAYEAAVRSVIDRGIESGEFRELDSRLATLALAGVCNWAYQWFSNEGPLTSREVAYAFWDILMRGFEAR